MKSAALLTGLQSRSLTRLRKRAESVNLTLQSFLPRAGRTVALVVSLSSIVGKELHRVAFHLGFEIWTRGNKLFGRIPECWYGLDI